jgi:hypothetical protein
LFPPEQQQETIQKVQQTACFQNTKAWKEAKKFCKELKRTSHLPELQNQNCMIQVGEDHTPSALHLRQVLSEDDAFGQKACVASMAKEGGHSWMKGCTAEGKMRRSLLMAALKKTAALKAGGCHCLQKITVSEPQGSGRAFHMKKDDKLKSFQIRQLLMREKVQWKKKDSALECFKHLAVENFHEEFVPCIQAHFDEIACILRTHAKHFLIDEDLHDGAVFPLVQAIPCILHIRGMTIDTSAQCWVQCAAFGLAKEQTLHLWP